MNPIARLYCLLSENNKRVVIYRKGPAKWTQLILWNLESDTFSQGQWLHGSIYPQKSDISPSGKYLATSIAKYSIDDTEINTYNSWTSISKPPYFTSLCTLFEKQGQSRGGYFEQDEQFVFDGTKDQIVRKGVNSKGKMKILYNHISRKMAIYGEHPLNEKRLTKLGWITKQQFIGNHTKTVEAQIKIKELNSQVSLILERWTDKFEIKSRYSIRRKGIITLIENAQWMDFDFRGRLLLAKNGKIFVSNESSLKKANIDFEELIGFNNSKPANEKAPDDYCKW